MNLCEQKNSYEKQCPSLASEAEGSRKLEPSRKRSGPHLRDGITWSVYCLFSAGRIRYVGITSHLLKNRLYGHILSSRTKTFKSSIWIRESMQRGFKIKIRLLAGNMTANDALTMEKQLITKYKYRLVNVRSGGGGFMKSELSKAKWKESRWGGKALTKRDRQLRKLEKMRAAKSRIRKERFEAGLLEREPKMERWFPFEFGVRDKRTGEMAWHDLVSVRHAAKALGLVMKYL